MSEDHADPEFDPSYIGGLFDAIARIRFDISEESNGSFTVRPLLNIKTNGTNMRELVVGNFLESRGYEYDFIDRSRERKFFRLQQRSDLEDLLEYLSGQSAQLIRELEFTLGPFASRFDFNILEPEEAYRFLLMRDELRYGWRPRGRHHIPPSTIREEYEINDDVTISSFSSEGLRSDYSIEWVSGVFDGCCRYRPSIAQSPEHVVGYAMHPVARLHRTGVHPSFVNHILRFCEDYNLNYGDSSDQNDLRVVFTGPSYIRRVLDILFPRLLVLAQHSAAMIENILPRFDNEEHHTKPGFYRLLRDFDPIAEATGGPFRHREYDPEHFAEIWREDIDTQEIASETLDEETGELDQERLDEQEALSLAPDEYRDDLGRYQSLVDRRHRDATQVRELKALYGDRCQLCGDRLARGDGTGYSEVHHLQPLGRPHDGPDVVENMLVLCPNHHADFDNGVILIDAKSLTITHPYDADVHGQRITLSGNHELARESLRYHNENISETEIFDRE